MGRLHGKNILHDLGLEQLEGSCLRKSGKWSAVFWNKTDQTQKIRAYTSCLELSLVKWTSGDWQNRRKLREGFIRHNEQVRSMVPKDNLLEFTPDMGWEPLCKYLGKPIPEEPYPYVNEGSHAADLHTPIFWIVGAITVARALFWPGVFGIATLGVWRYPKFWFILPLVSSPFLFRIRKIFSGPSPANVLQKH
jgi:hypothetical protein